MNAIAPASSFIAAQPVAAALDDELLAAGRKFEMLLLAADAAIEALPEDGIPFHEWIEFGVHVSEPAAIIAREILGMSVFTSEGRAVFIKAAEFVGGFRPEHIRH